MPRNDLYDDFCVCDKNNAWKLGWTHHRYNDEFRQEIKTYFNYIRDPTLSQHDRKDAETLQKICSAAYKQYKEERGLERAVIEEDVVLTVGVNEKVITRRYLEDPRTGKCDTAGVIRVPGFFKDVHPSNNVDAMTALHRFGIMPIPTPQSRPKSQPAKISAGIRGIDLSRSTDLDESHDILATVRHVSLCYLQSTFPYQPFYVH